VISRRPHDLGFSAVELLIALAIVGAAAMIAVPVSSAMIEDIRLKGDAHGLTSSIALAKLTGATQFTRSRLRVELTERTWQIERLTTTGTPAWISEGGAHRLSYRSQFGAGSVVVAPPNSQAVLSQPTQCLDAAGVSIADTACILYNSRGLPISAAGIPTVTQVLYLRGPSGVFAIVIGGSGKLEVWRTVVTAGGAWVQQ
jgi:prepilin-type N-terminal cleavage/methylation domain-containing protein